MSPDNAAKKNPAKKKARVFRTLRGQILALGMAITVPLFAVVIHATVAGIKENERHAAGLVVNLSTLIGGHIDRFISDAQELATNLARLPVVTAMNPEQCGLWFAETQQVFPQFTNVLLVDFLGHSVCSGISPASGASPDYSDREWFRRVIEEETPVVGKPRFGRHSGTWALAVASAVVNENDSLVGAVAVGIDLKRFQTFFDEVSLPERSIITVVDAEGFVVARSLDFEVWVGRQLPGDPPETEWYSDVSGVTEARSGEGEPMVWGFLDLRSVGWRVYTGVPRSWVYGAVFKAMAERVAMAAGGLILVLLLGGALYRRVMAPLGELVTDLKKAPIAGFGEVKVDGPKEVVEVVDAFNAVLRLRHVAQEEEKHTRQFFESIFSTAPAGAYVSTPEGRILQINSALFTMLGYDRQEKLVGKNVGVFHTDFKTVQSMLQEAEGPFAFELGDMEWVHRSGNRIVVTARGLTGVGANGENVVVVFVTDVTGRRETQKKIGQSQKLEVVGQFARGVASDFNDLLTAVRGNVNMLRKEIGDQVSEEGLLALEEMIDTADVAASLTNQLVMVSHLGVLRPIHADLNSVIQKIERLVKRLLPGDVSLEMALQDGIGSILIDVSQLEQVILNLVVNARDAILGAGSINIETRNVVIAEKEAPSIGGVEPGRYAMVTVVDTGHGMSGEVRAQAFEPFFSTKPDGPGLGLSLVRQVALDSGGTVLIDSSQGHGCRVKVLFPETNQPSTVPEPRPATVGTISRKGSPRDTVLLAEDNRFVRGMFSRVLRQAGYTVAEAKDGRDALKMFRDNTDDVGIIITDVVMPAMKGTEFVHHARQIDPDVPVIFMSASPDELLDGEVVLDGKTKFVAKPMDVDAMLQVVGMFFDPASDSRK